MAPRQELHSDGKSYFSSATASKRTISRIESDESNCDTGSETFTYDDSYANYGRSSNAKHPLNPTQGLPPTVSLPILVFIDMFAVSLVVPLLFQYYKNAGVTSANQRELLSSVFSSSQIVGGVVLGAMTDAQVLSRRTVLFVSFGGSALAYALVAFGGFQSLVVSRILVGLVKQTMTVTTSILAQCTTDEDRTKYMGRLQSSATASWIVGPSAGAVLFKYVDYRAPALLACALFLFNIALAAIFLRGFEEEVLERQRESSSDTKKTKGNFWANLKSCFSSPSLASVIAATLIFNWFNRATSYSTMGSYYEDMYGMEPHQRGYIQSYQQVLGFIIQSTLIGPLLSAMGGERRAVCLAASLLAAATFWEMQRSISLFLVALSPAISVSTTMMNVSLRSLLTRVAPEESIFSVFAALDVLQNACAVTVPFYRTFLFRILDGSSSDHHASMEGDPDPISWVVSSGLHWVIATLVMAYLLLPDKPNPMGSTNAKQQRLKRL